MLTPPRYAGITGEASTEWRTTIKPKMPEGLPVTCVQGPGDMMVVPPQWGHATINVEESIGIAHEFHVRGYSVAGERNGLPACRSCRAASA